MSIVVIVLALLCITVASTEPARANTPPPAGVDYVSPASTFTGCGNWAWLQASCYRNTTLTALHISPQEQLASDLSFVASNQLGAVRVWVSLDELFSCWDATTGYCGYDPQALANVDDVLAQARSAGVPLVLVLYTNSNTNGFHPEALDGNHGAMRAGYLTALSQFLAHVSQDPGIANVVAVDLLNEAYYQLERYFSTQASLGTFSQCAVAGISTACVDSAIIHPWLQDLYATAKQAAPSLSYTVSDTGRLLGTNQATWAGMYPGDVYDLHFYNDNPGLSAALYATARTLSKPWFAGEVGCGSGNTACTYNGVGTLAVDSWWLANLPADGAAWVMVEDRHAAWSYTQVGTTEVASLTSVGQAIAASNAAGATPTATPTRTPSATPSATPTPLPWNPPVTLPHGSPHGTLVETWGLKTVGGQVLAGATKVVLN